MSLFIDLQNIESRLLQNKVEWLDVALLLEEVRRLRSEQDRLRRKLESKENQLQSLRPVSAIYNDEANFPALLSFSDKLRKRLDHTER